MTKKTIHFEFTQGLVKEPLLYLLARKFDVMTNIRGASITDEGGFVVLEVEGDEKVIQEAVDYLVEQGIKVTEQADS
jgi:ABC-type methionine transport system ATPase subunit